MILDNCNHCHNNLKVTLLDYKLLRVLIMNKQSFFICCTFILMVIGVALFAFAANVLMPFFQTKSELTKSKISDSNFNDELNIPFRIKGGFILLEVFIEHKPIEAILDTGCASNFLTMPHDKDLKEFIPTGKAIIGFGGVKQTPGYFHRSNISKFELNNAYYYLSSSKGNPLGLFDDGTPITCILGNNFFFDYVITIDYPNKKIILRNKKYDLTKIFSNYVYTLQDVTYICDENYFIPAAIMIPSRIKDKEVEIMLDTGHYYGGLIADAKIFKNENAIPFHSTNLTDYGILGRKVAKSKDSVQWQIGAIKGKSHTLIMSENNYSNMVYKPVNAIIGYDQLRDCRVTIDYKRKKVLIERTADMRDKDFTLKSIYTQSPSKQNKMAPGCDDIKNPIPAGFHRVHLANGSCEDIRK